MNEKRCFLIGSRFVPQKLREKLTEAVKTHIIEYGVDTFIVGQYGNFDLMTQGILREVKQDYKHIQLYLLAPYAMTQKVETPNSFDGILYPEGLEVVPLRFAIVQANRKMVQNSDYLITYYHHIGSIRNIIEYARNQEKKGLIKVTLVFE